MQKIMKGKTVRFLVLARCWWVTPVIPATQEVKIRRIKVQDQPRKTVCETLS
jgi:hypothetical protein